MWYIVRVDAPPGVEVPGGSFVTVESGPHGGMAQALHALEHPKPRAHVLPDIVWLPEDARAWAVNQPVGPKPRLIVTAETVQQAREAKGGRGLVAVPARRQLQHSSSRGRDASSAEHSAGQRRRQQQGQQQEQELELWEPPTKRSRSQQGQQRLDSSLASPQPQLLLTPPPRQAGASHPSGKRLELAAGSTVPQQQEQLPAGPLQLFYALGSSAAGPSSPQVHKQQQQAQLTLETEGLAQHTPLPTAATGVHREQLPPSPPSCGAAGPLQASSAALAVQLLGGPVWGTCAGLITQQPLHVEQRHGGSAAPARSVLSPSGAALASLPQPPPPVRTVVARREEAPAATCPSAPCLSRLSPSHSQAGTGPASGFQEAGAGEAQGAGAAAATNTDAAAATASRLEELPAHSRAGDVQQQKAVQAAATAQP